MTQKTINLALVGFNDAWVETFLDLLKSHDHPISQLSLVTDNPTTEDPIYRFNNQSLMPQPINNFDFSQVDVAIFTDFDIAKMYLQQAKDNCQVLDQSGFALNHYADIELLIPGLTRPSLTSILALPDSSSLPLLMTLLPIEKRAKLSSVNIMTCQSVSGRGQAGLYELAQQSASLLGGKPFQSNTFNRQIAFNVLPAVGGLDQYGTSYVEQTITNHLQCALNDSSISIVVTSTQVPVFYSHATAVHVSTQQPLNCQDCIQAFNEDPSIVVKNQPDDYPTSIDASGHDQVLVGRLRQPQQNTNQLAFWTVADNLRQGVGLNIINALQYIHNDNG